MHTGEKRATADTPGDMKGNGNVLQRMRQTQRIMSMIRENKESHQMELVLN